MLLEKGEDGTAFLPWPPRGERCLRPQRAARPREPKSPAACAANDVWARLSREPPCTRRAADRSGGGEGPSGQQGIELAGRVERHEVVAAPDVGRADVDLRHGAAAG